MSAVELVPGAVTLEGWRSVYRDGAVPSFGDCQAEVERGAALVARAAAGDAPVYGVNTGFGKLASVRIHADQTKNLQRNLILSHACGIGEPLSAPVVTLAMAMKIASLSRGASGVRWLLIQQLTEMVRRRVTPVVPGQGSVGASGDLAPLAHIAAAMIGEGEAWYDGERLPGAAALARAGLEPIELAAKEGLALINGTQISTALALAGLFEAQRLWQSALITGAMATDAAMGSSAPFEPALQALRGHRGQSDAAGALRQLMAGSLIRESHRHDDERVQDPYCLRCQPQVMGACLELLRHAGTVIACEANAVTDNPLVLVEEGQIVSGGNFHASPVAFAADQIALAIAEIGSITERRIAMLVDPALNYGLPPFLTKDPGLNSGFMIAEVTAAALCAENKQRAAPCSIDSLPTSANQEDHVSMATHAARRLIEMGGNLAGIIGIELLLAAQGIDLRDHNSSDCLEKVKAKLRDRVPFLEGDRYMAPDVAIAKDMVATGKLTDAIIDIQLPALEAAS